MINTDFLSHVFGYDKYDEAITEHAVRFTYCDRAIKHNGRLRFLRPDLRGAHGDQLFLGNATLRVQAIYGPLMQIAQPLRD